MSSPSPLDWIHAELSELDAAQLLRQRVSRSGKLGPSIVVDGRRYLNFGGNDYLGIAADPRLQEVVGKTLLRGGWGSGASPLIVGRSSLHAELERRLATFLRCESALLFATGFAANAGTIPCLVGDQDVILSDAKNHASIIDGCRLSKASVLVYPHCDMSVLERRLNQAAAARRKLIVTDSLFSMDGDLAAVDALVQLATDHGAMLMVDEAHALGVWGSEGRGVSADAKDRVHIRVGTLSKALGSHGGFVAGSRELITYLGNRARSYVFSTAGPAAAASAALTALNIVRDEPERRERLLQTGEVVRTSLVEQGWSIGPSCSHIIPVQVGRASDALSLAEKLRDQQIWVPCIRPPSVPQGESRLRISLSSAHSDAMIETLLTAMAACRP